MRNIFLTIILSLTLIATFAQDNLLLNPKTDFHLDWKAIEVPLAMEEKVKFLNDRIDFEKIVDSNIEPYAKEVDNYHILDLNGDYELDILFYGVSNMRGLDKLTVYLNKDGKLESSFWDFGKIISIHKASNHSPFQISLLFCQGSIVEACKLTNVTIFNSQSASCSKDLNIEITIYYPTMVEFPKHQTINTPFRIKNEVYKLRGNPKIDNANGNVIAEFTKDDLGLAYASQTDSTGRVWWFVVMENNIKKDWTKFNHCESDILEYRDLRTIGWISSRYVEVIKE
jgi:hypothetical protein